MATINLTHLIYLESPIGFLPFNFVVQMPIRGPANKRMKAIEKAKNIVTLENFPSDD